MDKLKKYLEDLAEREMVSSRDDFSAYDYSGGNFDDAYSMGCSDGEISLAQELLRLFFLNNKELP